jgi:hypothetical protein
MLISKNTGSDKIATYFRHDIKLEQLVAWAENALMEGEFDEREVNRLQTVIARLRVAAVRAFGLTWEDCQEILRQLGYCPRVDTVVA